MSIEEQGFFFNDDAKLFFSKTGSGDPLILIHGACVDSDFFADTTKILARWFTVYTYDRRGYGRSFDSCNGSIPAQVDDLAALIHQIGAPCHIVAHSAGTIIAMEFAARYPQLVRKVILHEPFEISCLPAECAERKTLCEISSKVHAGKINSAMALFLPLLGERDLRARETRAEEMSHASKNFHQFLTHECDEFFRYSAPISALSRISLTIGIGELSKDTFRWAIATGLAKEIGAGLLYFPGGHNCAYDLPKEFAYLTAGAIAE